MQIILNKKCILTIVISSTLLLLVLLASMVWRSNKKEDDIWGYAVDVSNDTFSPAQFKFGTTIDEVLKRKGLTQAAIEQSYMSEPRIISSISISGWSEEITEICKFHNDKLVTVQYILAVLKEEKESACNILYEQAKKYMPIPMSENLEEIKVGSNTVMWQDQQGNYVRLEFPMTNEKEKDAIVLSINVSKEGITSLE